MLKLKSVKIEKGLIIPISLIVGLSIAIIGVIAYTRPQISTEVPINETIEMRTRYYLYLFYVPGTNSERQVNITRRVLASEEFKGFEVELYLIGKGENELWKNLTKEFDVNNYPSILFFRDSVLLWRHDGELLSEDALKRYLSDALSK